MSASPRRIVTRRDLLRTGAALGVGLSALPLLSAAEVVSAAPLQAPALQASGAIEFWCRETWDNGARIPVVNQRLAEFDSQNGTRSTAQFMVFQESFQKMQAALAAGTPPDLGQQGPDVAMQFAAAGHLLPLDDVMAEIGADRFAPLSKEAYVVYDGVTYGIPWYIETRILWYHQDLLDQAGVQPPTTWAEWVDAARALTTDDQMGFYFPTEGTWPGQFWVPLGMSNGGEVLDANGRVVIDNPQMSEALQFVTDFYTTHRTMTEASLTYKNSEMMQLFLLKKIAMVPFNAELYRLVLSQAPELLPTLGATTIPVNRPGEISRSFLGGFQLFVFKDGKNPSGGAELLKALLEDPWYTDYCVMTEGAALPVTSSAINSPFYQSDPIRSVLVQQEQTGVRYGGPVYGLAPFMGEAEGKQIFTKPVLDVMNGRQTVAGALTALDAELKQIAGQA